MRIEGGRGPKKYDIEAVEKNADRARRLAALIQRLEAANPNRNPFDNDPSLSMIIAGSGAHSSLISKADLEATHGRIERRHRRWAHLAAAGFVFSAGINIAAYLLPM